MPGALRNLVAELIRPKIIFYLQKFSFNVIFTQNMQIVGRQDTLKSFNFTILVASII
jgi:hypothetical protein